MIDSNSHTHGKSWRKHTHSWPPNQQKQRDTHKKPEAPPLFNLRMHTCWLEHTAAQQPHLWPVLLDCPWPWSLPGGSAAATSTGSPCQGTGHSSPPPHLRMPSPIALSPASISFSVVIYKWTSSRSRSDAYYPQWHPPPPPPRYIIHGSGMSHTTTASPTQSLRALWMVGDAMVGRGNAGWSTSKHGHPCPCRKCSQEPPAERTGRGSLLNYPSCPPPPLPPTPPRPNRSRDWTELYIMVNTQGVCITNT